VCIEVEKDAKRRCKIDPPFLSLSLSLTTAACGAFLVCATPQADRSTDCVCLSVCLSVCAINLLSVPSIGCLCICLFVCVSCSLSLSVLSSASVQVLCSSFLPVRESTLSQFAPVGVEEGGEGEERRGGFFPLRSLHSEGEMETEATSSFPLCRVRERERERENKRQRESSLLQGWKRDCECVW